LGGFKSYTPSGVSVHPTGGTDSARYCYTVWLRHLSILYKNGFLQVPNTIAELGPGDSIGTGLAGLLSGSKKFYALDVAEHTNIEKNISIFDELVTLFANHSVLPDDNEFPRVFPRLTSYNFPSEIFANNSIEKFLDKSRLQYLRNEIINMKKQKHSIQYMCPWNDPKIIENNSVDVVFSQAVLEHVEDLKETYQIMYRWVKKGGYISNSVDFESHGLSDEWNGHWSFSDLTWKLIKGNRQYLINREPLSSHIQATRDAGFEIISVIPVKTFPSDEYTGTIERDKLSKKFRDISEEDFTTTSAYILAKK
jgi:ubiquinone/menaquinone biosynthesis C-methylase UbiE